MTSCDMLKITVLVALSVGLSACGGDDAEQKSDLSVPDAGDATPEDVGDASPVDTGDEPQDDVGREDTEDSLRERVLAMEHRLYPEVVGWYAAGRLRLAGDRVMLDERVLASPVLREEGTFRSSAE